MPTAASHRLEVMWAKYRELIFPLVIFASILVFVVPLPAWTMDVLLACNLTVGAVVLLTTIYARKPLDFSVFPALLLGTTLARLVLNVASTRLILTRGASDGEFAAGEVIASFQRFVAGDSVAVGLIIFIIIVVIQFLVITKGATRISEVAARFALDGMPGKQMAIDADLNAGIISAEQAKVRREEISQQADFYGAMDGASKFVRGDAIAGIVITLINLVGGIYMGMVENDMTFRVAIETFTKLTIGDGLVSQVPAFLISLAAGLLITRSSSDSDLSGDMVGQIFSSPQAMWIAAGFLVALSFTGLPGPPLFILGAACAGVGYSLTTSRKHKAVAQVAADAEKEEKARPEPKPEDNLLVDPMELELGFGLIRLADVNSGGDLLDRVTRVRHKVAQELGIILPKVRIRDNIRLEQRQYQVKINDVAVAWGDAYPDGLLAIDTGATNGTVPGVETVEPAFGRPAVWIESGQRERAELMGYSVIEPAAVIVTHLTEVVRQHSDELLSRQQVHQLIDNLKERSPKVVEELIPDLLKTSQVHQVLTNLLREQVPIRNLEAILESLTDWADRTKDTGILTEYVRHGLSRQICQQLRDKNRVLRVITMDPAIEDLVAAGIEHGERGTVVKLSPQVSEAVTRGVAEELQRLTAAGHQPVIVVSPQIRATLKQITSAVLPSLAVLSLNEITRDTQVEAIGQVGVEAVAGAGAASAG
ncbi:flagellar biosynthesis protein FlhA [Symmachiella dynata]|uniref:Flagellar biosynthesis protein FlhA n=1 Tax=Symmachiella dynata TaxID=2527995 RepID=A0A517ZRH0_9PLAN|nr:flagellar biosynthesis protein FlhA [Symmachiella dynata]QDT49411.1 Flagellar biosynthesis protein FlhA [Symmachiella dynata]QDU45081.1 Flagellar biosynthesis protein FlhA [Symmachiella dynata]